MVINSQYRKQEKRCIELDLVNMEGTAVVQSCVSPKILNQIVLRLMIKESIKT